MTKFYALTAALLCSAGLALGLQPASAGEACGERYVVKAGETINGIAYKCGVSVSEIEALNDHVSAQRGLRSGMVLTLPGRSYPIVVRTAPRPITDYQFFTPDSETIPAGYQASTRQAVRTGPYYRVEYGDTLGEIAERYGTTVWDLMLVNPEISNPHVLDAGAYLRLPYGLDAPKPRARHARAPGEDISVVPLPSSRGTRLSVQLSDFPAGEKVKIGLGKSSRDFAIVSGGKTDRFGRLNVEFSVPDTLAGGGKMVVVAQTIDDRSAAVSQPIALPLSGAGETWSDVSSSVRSRGAAPAVGTRVAFEGVVTAEGKDCASVRDADGVLYSLTATEAQLSPGDIVRVQGIVAPSDWCSQGISIATASIAARADRASATSYRTGDSGKTSKTRYVETEPETTGSWTGSDGGAIVLDVARPFSAYDARQYVRGIVVSTEGRCTTVRGENGDLYSVEARLRSISVGDRVELIGETESRDPCGRGIGFAVEEARKYTKNGS